MRGDGTNHHEKLGLQRISCASEFTIPNMADTSPDPGWNHTDQRSSQPNPASRTLDFSYPVVSSTFISSSSHISFFLIENSTIIEELKVQLSLSISTCHDPKSTTSTAYTEYCVHCVQHPPGAASTQGRFSLLHSDDYELTPECSFSFQHASLHN